MRTIFRNFMTKPAHKTTRWHTHCKRRVLLCSIICYACVCELCEQHTHDTQNVVLCRTYPVHRIPAMCWCQRVRRSEGTCVGVLCILVRRKQRTTATTTDPLHAVLRNKSRTQSALSQRLHASRRGAAGEPCATNLSNSPTRLQRRTFCNMLVL